MQFHAVITALLNTDPCVYSQEPRSECVSVSGVHVLYLCVRPAHGWHARSPRESWGCRWSRCCLSLHKQRNSLKERRHRSSPRRSAEEWRGPETQHTNAQEKTYGRKQEVIQICRTNHFKKLIIGGSILLCVRAKILIFIMTFQKLGFYKMQVLAYAKDG